MTEQRDAARRRHRHGLRLGLAGDGGRREGAGRVRRRRTRSTSSRRTGCRARCSRTASRRPAAGCKVHHRRRRGSGAPAGHARVGDPAAGDRRPGAAASTSTAWTRCCRSCRCRPACRWRRCRSAAPATPGCSPSASSPRADPALRERMVDVPARARRPGEGQGRGAAPHAQRWRRRLRRLTCRSTSCLLRGINLGSGAGWRWPTCRTARGPRLRRRAHPPAERQRRAHGPDPARRDRREAEVDGDRVPSRARREVAARTPRQMAEVVDADPSGASRTEPAKLPGAVPGEETAGVVAATRSTRELAPEQVGRASARLYLWLADGVQSSRAGPDLTDKGSAAPSPGATGAS